MENRITRSSFLKYVLLLAILFILPTNSFCLTNENKNEAEKILEDIRIINLLNSLDLREEQMESILNRAMQVDAIRNNSLYKINRLSYKMSTAGNAIKTQVKKGKVALDKDSAKEFKQIKDEIKKIKKDADKRVNNIASNVEGELEGFQLKALEVYTPCVVPKVSNGRIGQADKGAGIANMLKKVQKLPDKTYEKRKEHLASRLVEKTKEKHSNVNGVELKRQILELFKQAREMNGVEFELKKKSIVEEFQDKALSKKRTVSNANKIKKFLLSKNTIILLKERLNNKKVSSVKGNQF